MPIETEIPTGLFSKKYIFLDDESLVWDDTQMMIAEMVGFSYGATVTRVNGIKANTEFYYRFVDNTGDEISFKFVSALLGSNQPDEINEQLQTALWQHIGSRMVTQTIHKITSGESFTIGECTISKNGIQFIRKPLFGKSTEHLIAWADINYEIYQGILILKSGREDKARTEMHLRDTLNALILLRIIEMIYKDPSIAAMLSGN